MKNEENVLMMRKKKKGKLGKEKTSFIDELF